MKICVSINHMGLGDMFTMNGAIRYLSENYDKVIVTCKDIYIDTIKQMFSDNNKIFVISVKTNGCVIDKSDKIFNLFNNENSIYKISGTNDIDSWNNTDGIYYIRFYKQIGLDYYNIRLKYEKIYRNYKNEIEFKDMCMKKYDKGYIFTHDHRGYIRHYDPRACVFVNTNDDIPIFHPNINYYYADQDNKYYNNWMNIISSNLLDYCKILEDATEIHITDSSFFCLCAYLDLSKVNKKYVYTKFTKETLIDYHSSFSDWTVIYN
jgi:hypothetical protein